MKLRLFFSENSKTVIEIYGHVWRFWPQPILVDSWDEKVSKMTCVAGRFGENSRHPLRLPTNFSRQTPLVRFVSVFWRSLRWASSAGRAFGHWERSNFMQTYGEFVGILPITKNALFRLVIYKSPPFYGFCYGTHHLTIFQHHFSGKILGTLFQASYYANPRQCDNWQWLDPKQKHGVSPKQKDFLWSLQQVDDSRVYYIQTRWCISFFSPGSGWIHRSGRLMPAAFQRKKLVKRWRYGTVGNSAGALFGMVQMTAWKVVDDQPNVWGWSLVTVIESPGIYVKNHIARLFSSSAMRGEVIDWSKMSVKMTCFDNENTG